MDTTKTSSSLVVASSSNEGQWQWPWRFHMLFKGTNFIYLQKLHVLIPFHSPSANNKRLISCINGLICFGETDSLEICNIFAGTNYYLISPSFDHPIWFGPVFAFGYDPISNDYKILIIENYFSWFIYSFVTNSWKPLNFYWEYCTVLRNSEGGRSVCINGVIYWPPCRRDHVPYYDKIVLFDLHIERFGLIQLPKEDLLLPTQYQDIQLLSFRGGLAFAFILRTSSGSHGGVVGEIWVELFTLNDLNLSNPVYHRHGNGDGEILVELFISSESKPLWNRHSYVVPIPSPTIKKEEVEIVSCCDEIFLGWFESNQLRLYNLHTKHIFNLPLSPPSHYYPKTSYKEKNKDNPTYVDNLSFDFSLI